MKLTSLDPVGAVISGLAVGQLSAQTAANLRGLLAEHGVLVFTDQTADDDAFTAFLCSFGPLTFTAGETPVEGHPDLNVVSNVGRTTPPRSEFHVDTSYIRRPPAYTALRAVTIPEQGGETLFTNQFRAYETLDRALREALDGRAMTHQVTGVDPGAGEERSAEHPIFRRHPLTGRLALYMSTPSRCQRIGGLTRAQAAETVAALYAHSTREENIMRHRWSPGDIVMWDNGCVLHRADHSQVSGDRVMHRGMVAAYSSAAAGE